MPKTRFIFNPHSGHNIRDPWLLDYTRDFIRQKSLQADIVLTERPRHATELAKQAIAEGCELVVAIGGDGTLNETAAALVGTDTVLGLVPCGSGNGLGRHLGISRPGKGAFRTLLEGRIRTIDTGIAAGHPFFNAMGIGFDAEISQRFNKLKRRGLSAYFKTTIKSLARYEPPHCLIRNGTSAIETTAFIAAVANSDQYGNDCFIAPGARVDDGLLDLTVIPKVTPWNILPLVVRLFAGKIEGAASIHRMRGDHFTIDRGQPGPIHTDGEVHEADSVIEVSVRPSSLRIMVPSIA